MDPRPQILYSTLQSSSRRSRSPARMTAFTCQPNIYPVLMRRPIGVKTPVVSQLLLMVCVHRFPGWEESVATTLCVTRTSGLSPKSWGPFLGVMSVVNALPVNTILMITTQSTRARSHMCVHIVGRASRTSRSSSSTRGFTPGRNHSPALTVENASTNMSTWPSTR